MLGPLANATWICKPASLHKLEGIWRIFFDTGAVRALFISVAPGGDVVASVEAIGHKGSRLTEATLVRAFSGIYTEGIPSLDIPAILGFESSDESPPPHKYRIRARFCQYGTAVLEAYDLTSAAESKLVDLRWMLRKAVAIRGGSPTDVPLILPGRLLPHAFEVFNRLRAWNLAELLAQLGPNHLPLISVSSQSIRCLNIESTSWSQRFRYEPGIVCGEVQSAGLVVLGRNASQNSNWNVVVLGRMLVASCHDAALDGSFMSPFQSGGAMFSLDRDGCFILVPKDDVIGTFQPLLHPTFPHLGFEQRILLPGFKSKGQVAEGVRLGNILFTIAAAIAIAADNGLLLRLFVAASWSEYFIQKGGILSELPASMWHTRYDEVDYMLGSPDNMRYEVPVVPPTAKSVMLHGYFQHPLYFRHRLQLVRQLLSPMSTRELAEAEWARYVAARSIQQNYVSVAIHLRLGDTAKLGKPALGLSFFTKALQKVTQRLSTDKLLHCVFFSDDIAAVSRGIASDIAAQTACHRHTVFEDGHLRDDVALMVMSTCCAAIVISASTFSWWAAVLGSYAIVVAPLTTLPQCSGNAGRNFTLSAMPGWTRLHVPCH